MMYMRSRNVASFPLHLLALFFVIFGIFFLMTTARAVDYSSVSFVVKDPVLAPAGYATSTGYSATITIGQIAICTSTVTAGSVREIRSGFEYFPFVSRPVPTATPGDGEVGLSWSAATGFLGWTVSGYSVGKSTISGGPYTYSAVGAVTRTTISGVSNGKTNYFVVVAKDFFSNFIATSTEVSGTPVASTPTPTPSPDDGGGIVRRFPGATPTPIVIPPLTTMPVGFCHSIADLDCDGYVDIVDFSIMYYWFDKSDPPPRVDLQREGNIDIADFSVMAYYWYERNE